MKKLLIVLVTFLLAVGAFLALRPQAIQEIATPQPKTTSDGVFPNIVQRFPELLEWERPEGPPRVALQVGHWKNDEVPEELDRIRNNTGASWGNLTEWQVNYEIAVRTKELLEPEGISVELLPATVPPSYWADAFISIHADGSEDLQKSGFKVAAPRRDYSGKADALAENIQQEYELATAMHRDPTITRNMTGYYAFSWWRNEHAIHPMTPAAILETGFLTNYADRVIIVDNPDVSAQGLANGILKYLKAEELI